MPSGFYEALWFFLIYSFVGWCCEVVFCALDNGKFVNRGMLNGPVCPIYGFGMLFVVMCLWNLRGNIFILFFGSVLLTSVIEFVTGFLLEKLFHDKWWDYSDFPMNIKGYVCLKFSLLWGIGASFAVGAFHPLISFAVEKTPFVIGIILLCLLSAVFATDTVITLIELLKLPKRMKSMLELEKLLDSLSDGLGENISDTALNLKEKNEDFKDELEEKKRQYKAYLEKNNFVQKRIFSAFPNLKSGKYKQLAQRISEYRAAGRKKKTG